MTPLIAVLNDILNKNIDNKLKYKCISYIINNKKFLRWLGNKDQPTVYIGFLTNAFYWADTQQGYNFWEDIHYCDDYLKKEIIFETEQQFIDYINKYKETKNKELERLLNPDNLPI